jgi:hypothetical protein
MSLPAETLDAARPALEDLRVYDDAGNELPYVIERPRPAASVIQNARSFQISLNPSATVITVETGLQQPLDGVTLESPADSFIKSVKIEGSNDDNHWQLIAQGQPIFRQSSGADQLHLSLPPGTWRWLRLTVDDQRSSPAPFTGARVHAAPDKSAPNETLPVAITERHENPGETRLALNLGAANLDIAAVQIETPEPLFMRQVALAVPQVSQDAIREQTLAQDSVYRVAIEGQPTASNLALHCEAQVRSRELLLLIKNQDSPPLPITGVRAERRPVYLAFLARQSGIHHLLTGNAQCPAPRYDLAALGANLKTGAVLPVKLAPLTANPNYRVPEVLSGIEEQGAALDVAAWKFRKPVQPARSGAQQVELDPQVLSHAQPGLEDLRLLRDGKQLPYILERTSISRALTPTVVATNDAKHPQLSRWILRLPHSHLPVTRLSCVAQTALFQRDLSLYEEATDDRAEPFHRALGNALWTRTPERKGAEFFMALLRAPETDTVILETSNGDNPPIHLEKFQLFYPATRVLFKAKVEDDIFLYYGNPRAAAPSYDLNLVAGQLFAANKATASSSAEQQLKKSSWSEGQPGKGGVLFWGILALVVVALLAIIARLLPKAPPPAS